MSSPAFVERLNEQIGHEFAAHQQYVAIAVYFDAETLPRLAAFFYAQALEERNHALMMTQFLIDQDLDPITPGVAAPQVAFDDVVSPVALALEQEKRVSEQINALAGFAREQATTRRSSSCSGSSRSRSRRSRRCPTCSAWSSAPARTRCSPRSSWRASSSATGARTRPSPPIAGG